MVAFGPRMATARKQRQSNPWHRRGRSSYPQIVPDKKMFPAMLRTVMRIPRGKVSTYGDVAYISGYPGSSRQVVWALRAGKGVPWHRVVGAGGKILLPAEAGMEQRFRLESEGVKFLGLRVDIDAHRWTPFKKSSPQRTRRQARRSQRKPS